MGLPTTQEDFEQLSWHDDTLYGLAIEVGDFEQGDWRAELQLDIDHIVEWVCGSDQRPRFQVAPATLRFHHVTDLKIAIDWGNSGGQTALHEASIDRLSRAPVAEQKICFDRPYYRWRLLFNWPKGGEIAFGASGFTQSLRAPPRLCDEQKLRPSERSPQPGDQM